MFGLFAAHPFSDPLFGELKRSRGYWRAFVSLDSSAGVLLAVSGPRARPDQEALETARTFLAQYHGLRPLIGQALYEHYLPYAEAVVAGEFSPPVDGLPNIDAPEFVWPHVTAIHVSVTPMEGVLTVEVGYRVAWDDEHTLGARFQKGRFVELCGSVLAP